MVCDILWGYWFNIMVSRYNSNDFLVVDYFSFN